MYKAERILLNRYVESDEFGSPKQLIEASIERLYDEIVKYLKKLNGYILRKTFHFNKMSELDSAIGKVVGVNREDSIIIRRYLFSGKNEQGHYCEKRLEYNSGWCNYTTSLREVTNKDNQTKLILEFYAYSYD